MASSFGSKRFDSVRQRLRHATHRQHTGLNDHPLLHGLTKPNYPLSMYQVVLVTYFHVYRCIEEAIDACLADPGPTIPFRYSDRRKLPWIVADLRYFGVDPETAANCPLRPPNIAVLSGQGQLIGTLYAIEGATLGGQIIARSLLTNLNLTATTGARFFSGYGDSDETARRWMEFESCAESVGDDPVQTAEAEIAAQRVFSLIESQLNDYYARLVR